MSSATSPSSSLLTFPWQSDRSPSCAEVMRLAERELKSFVAAVAETFGSEVARISAEEWLQELSSAKRRVPCGQGGLRLVTITALVRLAERAPEWEPR